MPEGWRVVAGAGLQVVQSAVVIGLAPLYSGGMARAEAIVASKRGVWQPYRDLAKLHLRHRPRGVHHRAVGGRRGQTIVAAIFGVFAAFWFSLFAVLLGLPAPASHDWFNGPAAQANETLIMLFMAWTIIFVFLTLGILRLPISYVLVLIGVDIAVLFVLLAIAFSNPLLFVVAGAGVLFFCAVGLYAFLNTAWVATGAKRDCPRWDHDRQVGTRCQGPP